MQSQRNSSLLCAFVMLAMFLLPTSTSARGAVAIPLPDKRVVIVAEGDLEPMSTGSYTVSVYKDESFADYIAGTVLSRNGSLFKSSGNPHFEFADITGDGIKELVLFKRTTGSGQYIEVDALRIDARAVKLIARVRVNSRADVMAELKARYAHLILSGRPPR